jgi:putative spermidine/putrescine transport system substrate-binding protein
MSKLTCTAKSKSVAIAAFAGATLALAGNALARDLMIVGFGGGFQDNARTHLFQGYAKAAGQPVKDDVYNGEMAKVYSMVKAKDVTWDVIMVEAPELVRGCEDGVFEKIDWSVVKKDKFINGGTSPCGAGAVLWGVTLFYDQNRIKDGPDTFAKLWDTRTYPGKRSFRNGPKMTLEIALLADGVPPADVYKVLATPEGQKRAFDKLDQIKKDIVWWKSGTQPVQLVGSGEVAYAVGYTGRIARANEGGAKYPLLWKTLLYSVDYWTVVKGSPNAREGMKMIDWITDAKPLVALSETWAVSPANAEAAANPKLREKNPAMLSAHAPEGLFIDTEFWVANGDDLEKKFNAWIAK